ncbi:hypothetical protein CONLIGDRAFT_715906 [Coniochaeta ligniaria NRRL 30616]|uniref:Uncharacterized protein n=1 Tax=Coniochaeta ligniaria NRRL 30616 TaxID=1408157 RepID=A0A1J7JCE0_9PEZI|nr:hypothetical protein CONLIGDRAFT_715906 [Coniochaeta ligniaria NRRL 30616]
MAQSNSRRLSMDHRVSFDRRNSFERPPISPATDVRPQPSVLAEEPIPRMKSIAPCIFVPLETDITKPRDPPRNRVEKLERLIASAGAHRQGVLENIAFMAEHERRSILQYGRQQEAMAGIPQGPGPSLPPDEIDWIMDNMAAPAPKDRDLNIKDEADLQQLLLRNVSGMPPQAEPSNREQVARDLVLTVAQAAQNAKGYSGEVDRRIWNLSQLLEKEKKRLEDAGKRPEER